MTLQEKASCDDDDDDDDMPPLEYVGSAGKQPPPEDDDDEMPPLDYVGLRPEAPKKAAPAPADDDDDDMPPLEYVGMTPKDNYSFREGARVRLKGLSKADLNGQAATILPFLNSTKDRLPVKLDSTGKSISVKPENLENIADAAAEDSDDSMPPLEAGPGKKEESEDEMPPLEAPVKAAAKVEESDDDEMPPLEDAGRAPAKPEAKPEVKPEVKPEAPKAKSSSGWHVPVQKTAADEEELPPLEGDEEEPFGGLKEGDKVLLKGLRKADLNGRTGTVLCLANVSGERIPINLGNAGRVLIKPENLQKQAKEESDDEMPPLEAMGTQPAAKAAKEESSDDDMPPLEADPRAAKPAVKEESDDEMPPLEEEPGRPPAKAAKEESDDDEMPPLEYVGAAAKEQAKAVEESDDDDMPPLEHMGTATQPAKPAVQPSKPAVQPAAQPRKATAARPAVDEDDDDDMPPLEYVGTTKAAASSSFKEGDKVVLKGLSKAELNGSRATVMAFSGSSIERLPVILETSKQRLSIKPENLEPAQQAADSDDDDMPPLEYVGAAAPAKASQVDDDDDEMPPLEPMLEPAKKPAPPAKQEESDDDDMPPLEYMGTAPAAAKPAAKPAAEPLPEPDDDDDDMPPLEYVGNSAPPKTAPAAKAAAKPAVEDDDDDDDMPPLEYVGVASAAPKKAGSSHRVELKKLEEEDDEMPPLEPALTPTPPAPAPTAADDGDDDMPPLEGSSPSIRPGEVVTLRGLSKSDLNGQRGTVLPFLKKANGRLPVRLDSSGMKVSIKPENLEKAGGKAADSKAADGKAAAVVEDKGAASDDSMPPLDYVGTAASKPAAQKSARQQPFRVGDTVALNGLKAQELNGELASVLKEAASDGRIQVQLQGSGKKLLVKPGNLTRTEEPPAKKAPESFLEQMRAALQSSTVAPVLSALAAVEAADVEWGDALPEKKKLLKKLRAKRRKLQPAEDSPETPPPVTETAKAKSPPAVASGSSNSDKDWVVLNGAAAPQPRLVCTPSGPKAAVAAQPSTLRQWCEEMQLPLELLDRLEKEEVKEPQELTGVPEEELAQLTTGWKMGPKGRFMKAVRRMRALEQAELGSTCGSVA